MSDTLVHPKTFQTLIEDNGHRQRLLEAPPIVDAMNKSVIADMPRCRISQMTCNELARVIRAADMRLLRKEVSEHLESYDRETLERLVYLVRRCCRNQGY